MTQDEIGVLSASHIIVGLSALVTVKPSAFQHSQSIKILSGGGTLEIVPIPVALSGSSATGWGLGYPIGSNEVVSFDGPTVFYLAATGATMTACSIIGDTVGASTL